jgi:hypothetical protein
MAKYKLPLFNELDTDDLDNLYEAESVLNGRSFKIDLSFDNGKASTVKLEAVEQLIVNIAAFDGKNKAYIAKDYADNTFGTVRTYVEHHLEELDKEQLKYFADIDKSGFSTESQIMKSLHLVRVGLYPDHDDQFAIFDYSIGKDLTQYLVVIVTDKNGNLKEMAMES